MSYKDELMGLFSFNPQRTETLFSTVKFHPKFQIFHDVISVSKSMREKVTGRQFSHIIVNIQRRQGEEGYMEGSRRSSVFRPASFSHVALAKPFHFSIFSVTEGKTMPPCLMWLSVFVVFAKYCQFLKQRPYVKEKFFLNSRRWFSTCSHFDYLMKLLSKGTTLIKMILFI